MSAIAGRGITMVFETRRGSVTALEDVSLEVPDAHFSCLVGASGCGKSTLLRCMNRMHETVPGAKVRGEVWLAGQDIYAPGTNAIRVRRLVGMVFQRPTPFPTMSIRDNVAAGLRVGRSGGRLRRSEVDAIVERALRRTALWDEVKDRLNAAATGLSGGQQQRLCIARALATEPPVLLLDEPMASLDPISTQRVEELVYELRQEVTIAIVTHNMQQAARIADMTAFFSVEVADDHRTGILIEYDTTPTIFTHPNDKRTEDYVTGRFG